jgi:hypothetical protein
MVEQSPEETLRAFIHAMHQWELEEHQHSSNLRIRLRTETVSEEEISRMQQATLARQQQIFDRYCTPEPRPHGRQGSFGHPPEYDPAETIIEVEQRSPARLHIFTQQRTGFRHKRRYVLLKQKGRWLIDSVQWQASDGSWQRDTL